MPKKRKLRLDQFLLTHCLVADKDEAQKKILAGWVKVNQETIYQAQQLIAEDATVVVANPNGEFVSRGGYKLKKALQVFPLTVADKVAADLGSSTGGFTDCLLQSGASHVYAIDVGTNQLAYSLRVNENVTVWEKTHVNALTKEKFGQAVEVVVSDLSFISMLKVMPTIWQIFAPAQGIMLIKPQFEALENEHQKGIVLTAQNHQNILERVLTGLQESPVQFLGLDFSPIKGPKGNIEFILFYQLLSDENQPRGFVSQNQSLLVQKIVAAAHQKLNK